MVVNKAAFRGKVASIDKRMEDLRKPIEQGWRDLVELSLKGCFCERKEGVQLAGLEGSDLFDECAELTRLPALDVKLPVSQLFQDLSEERLSSLVFAVEPQCLNHLVGLHLLDIV